MRRLVLVTWTLCLGGVIPAGVWAQAVSDATSRRVRRRR